MLRKYLIESMTHHELIHKTAQLNAALPIEKGGLGLHPNNTALERANAMGYATKAYHGTKHNFTEFKKDIDSKTPKDSYYFSSSPNVASTYADPDNAKLDFPTKPTIGGHVIPVLLKHNKVKNVNAKGDRWNDIVHLYKNGSYDTFTIDDYARMAKDEGKLGLTVKNTVDTHDASNIKSHVYVTFKPHHIRSIHAAFDPMRQHESDIMA